ncbi:uncharacterized protein LOC134705213 [Mytilus trossulus]|uniref:uncharacterized protein LOC134705213 n=1 Tax=Mytilus trossulus TaxID=6551 RepID=UPI003006DEFB
MTLENTSHMPTKSTSQVPTNHTTQMTTKSTSQTPTNRTTQMKTKPTTLMTTQPTTLMTTKPTTLMTTKCTCQLPTNRTTQMTIQSLPQVATNRTTQMTTQSSPQVATNRTTEMTTKSTFEVTTDRLLQNTCMCPCSRIENWSRFENVTIEELAILLHDEIEALKKELTVKKKSSSKYIRTITSAPDDRTSSKSMGFVSIVCIIIPFALIIMADILNIYLHFRKVPKNKIRFVRCQGSSSV